MNGQNNGMRRKKRETRREENVINNERRMIKRKRKTGMIGERDEMMMTVVEGRGKIVFHALLWCT